MSSTESIEEAAGLSELLLEREKTMEVHDVDSSLLFEPRGTAAVGVTSSLPQHRPLSLDENYCPEQVAMHNGGGGGRHVTALAWSPTTSVLARVLIPLLIAGTHGLFWYGQTANMWQLTAVWKVDVRYDATHSTKARLALEALHVPTSDTYTLYEPHRDVQTFTYVYAIQELWRAQNLPDTPVLWPRIAAGGLVLFSGLWPHLKLGMLLLTWWFAKHPVRRRRALSSLSILGKWSLVDVLVVCVMVGVLNLQWDFTAVNVMQGVKDNLPLLVSLVQSLYNAEQICSAALPFSCASPSKATHIFECRVCKSTVNTVYDHPDSARMILNGIDTEGGGRGQLSVVGLEGIYAFCGAVILSILLSLAVDWYDHKSRMLLEQESRARLRTASNEEHSEEVVVAPEISGTLSIEEGDTLPPSLDNSLHQLLLADNGMRNRDFRSVADMDYDRRILIESQQTGNMVWQAVSAVTALSVLVAAACITMERRVYGALPDLLHNILGVVWTKQYSFWLLGWTTGLAGGWDVMLMSTFFLFIVIGPIVRSVLCYRASRLCETTTMSPLAVAIMNQKKRNLSTWIDFIGAFCAWEVFTVAVFMVDLLMPSITSTIIEDDRCAKLAQDNSSTCLEVEFDMKRTFWLVIVSGFMLLLVSRRIRSDKTSY